MQKNKAPVHTSLMKMDAVKECGFEVLSNSPYAPNLAPNYCHLFPKLKVSAWKRYSYDDEFIDVVQAWSEGQNSDFQSLEALYYKRVPSF